MSIKAHRSIQFLRDLRAIALVTGRPVTVVPDSLRLWAHLVAICTCGEDIDRLEARPACANIQGVNVGEWRGLGEVDGGLCMSLTYSG